MQQASLKGFIYTVVSFQLAFDNLGSCTFPRAEISTQFHYCKMTSLAEFSVHNTQTCLFDNEIVDYFHYIVIEQP